MRARTRGEGRKAEPRRRGRGMGPRTSPPPPSAYLAWFPPACWPKHPLLPWIARLRLTPNPFCLERMGLERDRIQNPSGSFGCPCSWFLFRKFRCFRKVLVQELLLHLTMTCSFVGDPRQGNSSLWKGLKAKHEFMA